MKSVLFKINCDTRRPDTKPFADISHLSCFENEKEILFMLGSVFRLEDIGDSYRHLYTYDLALMNFNRSLEILTNLRLENTPEFAQILERYIL